MSQSLLQRFFDVSLIPSDTTDERLGHYQAAAADIAKRFDKAPRDAVSASRVAIDPKCPASDPWFTAVQDAVKVHWKTFLANHHDAPRQICRAILLEALSISATEDENLSAAVWNAASNLLPHLGSGPEQNITREFISKLGDEYETYSSEIWQLSSTSATKPPAFALKLPALESAKISAAELTKGLSDAAGPHNAQSKNFGNHNPHWTNSAPHWSYEFAPRAAKAIASEVNEALAAISPLLKGVNEQLEPALNRYAATLGEWVINSSQRSKQFTTLLWWKQALYSPSLKRSYRKLSPASTAIALSFDLGSVSGAPVPLSVEYFLRETIFNVLPENQMMTLAELAAATKTSDAVDPCLPTAPNGSPLRISLREFLSVYRQAVPADETIPAYTGIVPSTSLPVSEWAVWLLRERLAEILTAPEA